MRTAILLLSILALASPAIFHVGLERRHRKTNPILNEEFNHHDTPNRIGPISKEKHGQKLRSDFGKELVAKLTLGSTQKFDVVIDTGSSILWVTDVRCKTALCLTKRRYNESASHSHIPTSKKLKQKYLSGEVVNVMIAKELASVGGLVLSNQPFGKAFEMQALELSKADGMLGLSLPEHDDFPGLMVNAINRRMLDDNIFTLYVNQTVLDKNEQGGHLTYGGLDPLRCEPVVNYVNVATARKKWDFQMTAVGVVGNYTSSRSRTAYSDSGASEIIGPAAEVDRMLGAIFARNRKWISDGDYVTLCNATLPDITFRINGVNYPVPSKAYLREYEKGWCMVAIVPHTDNDKHWELGLPFMSQYCHVHDYGKLRLGFSLAKQR